MWGTVGKGNIRLRGLLKLKRGCRLGLAHNKMRSLPEVGPVDEMGILRGGFSAGQRLREAEKLTLFVPEQRERSGEYCDVIVRRWEELTRRKADRFSVAQEGDDAKG